VAHAVSPKKWLNRFRTRKTVETAKNVQVVYGSEDAHGKGTITEETASSDTAAETLTPGQSVQWTLSVTRFKNRYRRVRSVFVPKKRQWSYSHPSGGGWIWEYKGLHCDLADATGILSAVPIGRNVFASGSAEEDKYGKYGYSISVHIKPGSGPSRDEYAAYSVSESVVIVESMTNGTKRYRREVSCTKIAAGGPDPAVVIAALAGCDYGTQFSPNGHGTYFTALGYKRTGTLPAWSEDMNGVT
jgi:hypothetical protein